MDTPTTSLLTVDLADAKVSTDRDSTLATYSLGSCIGVCVYDPAIAMAGMLHFQLPTSTLNPQRASEYPMMFADTGLAAMLDLMRQHGGDLSRMKVKLAGGAEMLNDAKLFNIGRRNHTAVRKVLWQHGLLIERENIGGNLPRTLYMRVADGVVFVKSNGNTTLL